MHRPASLVGELDFKAVAQSESEVENLARRLGDNLMLPLPEVGAKWRQAEAMAEGERMRPARAALVALIKSAARIKRSSGQFNQGAR